MIDGWIIVALSFLYIGGLFGVAYWGDRAGRSNPPWPGGPTSTRWPWASTVRPGLSSEAWARRRKRARFHRGLPGADCRFCAGGAAAAPDRPADQDAEYHLDRRFHCRALRQEPRRCGNRDRGRGRGAPAVHRLAAQGGVPGYRAALRLSGAGSAASSPCRSTCPFDRAVWRPSPSCSARGIPMQRSISAASCSPSRPSRW